jgi:hypothetical protein
VEFQIRGRVLTSFSVGKLFYFGPSGDLPELNIWWLNVKILVSQVATIWLIDSERLKRIFLFLAIDGGFFCPFDLFRSCV